MVDELVYGFFDFIHWADGMVILAVLLIIADLVFGVRSAKVRGEIVRKSRAIKRTMNKMCSYLLWILVSFSFGEVFGKPFAIDLLPTIIIFVIYAIELESVFTNYFEWRGIKAKVNIFKFFSKKTNIIEIEKEDTNKSKNEENEIN